MADRLYWNTVKPILKEVLTILMHEKLFDPFRLVGGTSLSLQLGHRMSDDIDLFTDEGDGSLNFTATDNFSGRRLSTFQIWHLLKLCRKVLELAGKIQVTVSRYL